MNEEMIKIPLVWVASLLMLIAVITLIQSRTIPFRARLIICGFLLCLAGVGVLLGLRLSYGSRWAGRVQPLVAVMVPPLAFLGFRYLAEEESIRLRRSFAVHAGFIIVVQIVMMVPTGLSPDLFILAVTIAYLFPLILLNTRGADEFILLQPRHMPILRAGIFTTIVWLATTIVSDGLIVAAGLLAGDGLALRFLTGVTGLFTAFVVVVVLVGIPMAVQGGARRDLRGRKPVQANSSDRALLSRVDAALREKHLFRDTSLTLVRLARRLSVPARDVSNAVNRCTGENFSRYINSFRVAQAQHLLRDTDLPVTEVMFEAGFLSKSSFNSEFRRIAGRTPSQYRADGAAR